MANKLSDIKAGCEWIATHLAAIRHGYESKDRFFTYTIEQLMSSFKDHDTDPGSMCFYLEEPEITHGGNADNNLHQHWPITFMLLKYCDTGELAEQEAAKATCLAACYKVMARFKYWRYQDTPTNFASDNHWRDLHLETTVINFMNNVWDGRYGIRCSFELREPIIGQLEIVNEDWV